MKDEELPEYTGEINLDDMIPELLVVGLLVLAILLGVSILLYDKLTSLPPEIRVECHDPRAHQNGLGPDSNGIKDQKRIFKLFFDKYSTDGEVIVEIPGRPLCAVA